jgi:hypothetical protein
MHAYEPDPQSGAGNCRCGWGERWACHPHAFAQMDGREVCVCYRTAGDPVHTDAATAQPRPVRTGPEAVREAVRLARGGPAPPQVRGYA